MNNIKYKHRIFVDMCCFYELNTVERKNNSQEYLRFQRNFFRCEMLALVLISEINAEGIQ